MERITEQSSNYRHLEKMSIEELTKNINNEDKKVPLAIEDALPQINKVIGRIVYKLQNGGRLFYVGAGSGGRLSVLDAIELPTTYGVSKDLVNVILAGGLEYLVEAREEEEDDTEAAWKELQDKNVSNKDFVLGISASGTTPFVLSCLSTCREHSIETACLVSNPQSPIAAQSDYPIEVITGPEFLTGSTRMKCGSAQKMVFDMISTTVMIQLGRVLDNRMVNVKLINNKIIDRSVKMLMEKGGIEDYDYAKSFLFEQGNVQKALDKIRQG